ncbi:DUF1131 family protein, partial [Enterobacter asburiae]|uniref:DUF1131 family protein n=1 Tax=Enterobacter asburiae TaxID=61645 RepID=UPI0032D973E3
MGTPFSELYKQAFGNCTASAPSDDKVAVNVRLKAASTSAMSLTGTWSGPEVLMPSDDTLKSWKVSTYSGSSKFAPEQTASLKSGIIAAINATLTWHLYFRRAMSQVQSGILPEHCRAAIWIEANVKGDVDALRAASKA